MTRRKEKHSPRDAASVPSAVATSLPPPPTAAQKWLLGAAIAAEAAWLGALLAMALAG